MRRIREPGDEMLGAHLNRRALDYVIDARYLKKRKRKEKKKKIGNENANS